MRSIHKTNETTKMRFRSGGSTVRYTNWWIPIGMHTCTADMQYNCSGHASTLAIATA